MRPQPTSTPGGTRRATGGESAAKDPLTGEPLENPEHGLWLQSTALQTALMEAYLAQRLAELTVGLGAVFVGVGAGLAAAAPRGPAADEGGGLGLPVPEDWGPNRRQPAAGRASFLPVI